MSTLGDLMIEVIRDNQRMSHGVAKGYEQRLEAMDEEELREELKRLIPQAETLHAILKKRHNYTPMQVNLLLRIYLPKNR